MGKAMQPRQGQGQSAIIATQQQIISGPLPMADEFKGYEATLPGSADRILSMAELEAVERRTNTRSLVKSQIFQNYAGPILGALVSILALTFGFILAMNGKDIAGFSAIIAGAVAMAGSIITALRKPR
jgi:uncharacterized membrane protein